MHKSSEKTFTDMLELTRGPAFWAEVHRSISKGIIPTWVSIALNLAEWTRHIVGLLYLVAAHKVHSSGCRLQLISELVWVKTSVIKMTQPRGKLIDCAKLINHWPDITCSDKAVKHYKEGDLTNVKSFVPFQRHVNHASTKIFSENPIGESLKRDEKTCQSWLLGMPPGQKCTVAAARKCF